RLCNLLKTFIFIKFIFIINQNKNFKVSSKIFISKKKREAELASLCREYTTLTEENTKLGNKITTLEKEKDMTSGFTKKYGISGVYLGLNNLISILVDDKDKLDKDEGFKKVAQPIIDIFEERYAKQIEEETENLQTEKLETENAKKTEEPTTTPTTKNTKSDLEIK
ncbi:MAG: hypothetical protein K2K31_03005, partial [Clostridia bacterium]|nr:hypothetical protein [Clostridia bacterium]